MLHRLHGSDPRPRVQEVRRLDTCCTCTRTEMFVTIYVYRVDSHIWTQNILVVDCSWQACAWLPVLPCPQCRHYAYQVSFFPGLMNHFFSHCIVSDVHTWVPCLVNSENCGRYAFSVCWSCTTTAWPRGWWVSEGCEREARWSSWAIRKKPVQVWQPADERFSKSTREWKC